MTPRAIERRRKRPASCPAAGPATAWYSRRRERAGGSLREKPNAVWSRTWTHSEPYYIYQGVCALGHRQGPHRHQLVPAPGKPPLPHSPAVFGIVTHSHKMMGAPSTTRPADAAPLPSIAPTAAGQPARAFKFAIDRGGTFCDVFAEVCEREKKRWQHVPQHAARGSRSLNPLPLPLFPFQCPDGRGGTKYR